MVARILSLAIVLLAAAAELSLAVPAAAQCRLCERPTTEPEAEAAAPVRLAVDTQLDFDRLVLAGAGSGSAVIGPDGSRQASGAVLAIGGRAMVGTVTVETRHDHHRHTNPGASRKRSERPCSTPRGW